MNHGVELVVGVCALAASAVAASSLGASAASGSVSVPGAAAVFSLGASATPGRIDAGGEASVKVVEAKLAPGIVSYRRALSEARPPLRGFRAPSLDRAAERTAFLPDALADAPLREAVTVVVRDLAREGLCATLVRAVDALGADAVKGAARVEAAGVPVDLLTFFEWDGVGDTRDPDVFVRTVAERLAAGTTVDALVAELAQAEFVFRPSGFSAASESGEHDADTLRVQFTRGDTWLGDGDGSNLDLARQAIEALPGARVLGSVEARHLDELLATLAAWELVDGERITLASEALVVAQWAQDNGKAGYTRSADDPDARKIATLVPRYASRGEGGSTFVPGESFLVDGLAAAGHALVRSPLLFQGGNLLVAYDPRRDERVALVGEAEVYRNVALGLTEAQALDALRLELDVGRCVVLPAVSFHIDAEVTLRSHEGELIAFVNDEAAAIPIVLNATIDAFERAQTLDGEPASRVREAIEAATGAGETAEAAPTPPDAGQAAHWMTAIDVLGGALGANSLSVGVYPESFAKVLETDAVDPGAANLQTFLLALDKVTGRAIPIDQLPDRHAQAYLRSFERTTRDRKALHDELERNGWRLVPVPSLPGEARGRNYVNALHDRAHSLVPVYGGLFEDLDRAALDVYERTLGSAVRVVPIRAAESQRRSGAVHCSIALYPAP